MHKKLTISVDEKIYAGLHNLIGRGNISRFLEELARPHLEKKRALFWPTDKELEEGYKAMAADEEYMKEAMEWIEDGIDDGLKDLPHETW